VRYNDRIDVIEPAGKPVRVRSITGTTWLEVDGVSIIAPSSHMRLQNLPPQEYGVLVVVSQISALVAAQLHPERHDIVYPDSSKYGGAERSINGVMSVNRFIRAT
jgi:hypothetical protein